MSLALFCLTSLTWADKPFITVLTDADLRTAIDTVQSYGIKLGADILLSNSTLSINNGHTVTIDLNGHKLDRGLTERGENGGTVITVRDGAYLYLTNGTITGGWGGDGGALSVEDQGWAQLTNITATGNTADNAGGGICVKGSGVLNMSGGAISNNTCNDVAAHSGDEVGGGGLFVEPSASVTLDNVSVTGNKNTLYGGGGICNYGTLTLSGATSITGNKAVTNGGAIWQEGTLKVSGTIAINNNLNEAGIADNLYLHNDALITVTGSLTGSTIGVLKGATGVFTSGYKTYNQNDPQAIFRSDLPGMTISLQGDEAQINKTDPNTVYYNVRSWDAVNKCVVTTVKSIAQGQYTVMPNNSDTWYNLTNNYYVVKTNVTVKNLDVLPSTGDTVHIILGNGATLNFEEHGSINVRNYKTLCIHDQPGVAGNLGKLRMGADDGRGGGIGYLHGAQPTPGTVEIHGGDIRIDAANSDGTPAIGTFSTGTGINDKFIFYAGKIYAHGGSGAAGIGGGNAGTYCGNITIYGGYIEAIGGQDNDPYSGAGIGGGNLNEAGSVAIYGGHVIARGGHEAAGIGTAQNADRNNISVDIYGGYVEAHGDNYAAGIGGGDGVSGCVLNIRGGEVYAYGGVDAAGIGGGEGGNGGTFTITGGYAHAEGKDNGAGIGGGEDGYGAVVSIQGGRVYARAGSDETGCRAIGPGKGNDNYGSLSIGDELMVYSERKAAASERQGFCWYRTRVHVETCDHSDGFTYTVDGHTGADHHISHCPYCKYSETHLHDFSSGTTCSVCGVQGSVYHLYIYMPGTQAGPQDGKTYRRDGDVQVVPQTQYLLPECTVQVPGLIFIGWELVYENLIPIYESQSYTVDTATLYQPGAYCTITQALPNIVARYRTADITLYDDQPNNEALLQYNGVTVNSVTLSGRTFLRDNTWQVITLPFALTAEQIAASPLAGCELKELDTKGKYNGDSTCYDVPSNTLYLYFKDATTIEAGKPYVIRWASGVNIDNPVFSSVTISNAMVNVNAPKLYFTSLYSPKTFASAAPNIVYLGANNAFLQPDGTPMAINAFRAYFRLIKFTLGLSAAPLTIVTNLDGAVVPTDIEEVPSDQVRSTKVLRRGLIFIERDGHLYNIFGIRVL